MIMPTTTKHQLSLPAFRNTDPSTSKNALKHQERELGVLTFVRLVAAYKGRTTAELVYQEYERTLLKLNDNAERFGKIYRLCDRGSKRISDASRLKLIEPGPVRECSITGRKARTWTITEKGMDHLFLNPKAR